jgi:hypothetical protein
MPKRKGHIFEQIADMDNLRAADKEAQAGKVKKNRHIRRHNLRAEEDLLELQRMILELDFPDPDYEDMDIHNDSGKDRKIGKQKYFPWRILHHAIMRVIGPDVYKNLIFDTFACVPGKGIHHGVRRLKMMLRRYPEYKYFWKADYKKFYQSTLHEVAMAPLRRKFKDERFLKLMELAIFNYDSGQEIIDMLNDEQERKCARSAHRRISKPAYSQSNSKQDRPSHEGGCALQVLSPE